MPEVDMLLQTDFPSRRNLLPTHIPPAIVLGGGRTGLGIVRSLAQAGIRSIVVSNNNDDIAIASRHAQKYHVGTFEGESFVEDLLRLRTSLPEKGVLLFSDDCPLTTVSRHRHLLADAFHFNLPPHDLIVQLGLKLPFFEIAQKLGFPVPATQLLCAESDLTGIDALRPPLCVKPNGRSEAYDSKFKKAYRLDSCAEAITLTEQILSVVPEVIVQEWIEGPNDSIFFSLCSMSETEPVCFTGRKGRSWPPQIGVTASCWAAPDMADELETITTSFFRAVGITTGLASMEFKRDQRDGRFLMVEPTVGRANLQEEIAALCGINICQVNYCDAADLPRPQLNLDASHIWRDELRDKIAAKLLGVDCYYPEKHIIHNAYWRWDDPAPAIRTILEYPKRIVHRFKRNKH